MQGFVCTCVLFEYLTEQVEVWFNGHPTGMSGEMLKAFFESMPAEALARIEVIKNPSAKYMVEEGKHIINIVTSAKLRTSELWLLGLSGNTRPYLLPWFSYVRNSDRLKFNIHLAGSHSHASDNGDGDIVLTDGCDTTSRYRYISSSERARYFSDLLNNNLNSEIVTAPTYASNSSSHVSSRYVTFGLTWRIGKLDLEYQARGGAARQ